LLPFARSHFLLWLGFSRGLLPNLLGLDFRDPFDASPQLTVGCVAAPSTIKRWSSALPSITLHAGEPYNLWANERMAIAAAYHFLAA
jgi:hypothetical protein